MSERALNDKIATMTIEEMSASYKDVFSSPSGKLVLQDLKNRCYVKAPTYTAPNSVNPDEVLVREGMRSVYLHIQTLIEYEAPTSREVIDNA